VDRQSELANADTRLRATARFLAVHAAGALEAGDAILTRVTRSLDATDLSSNAEGIHNSFVNLLAGVPQVSSLWVLDAKGYLVAENWNHPPKSQGNFEHRDYFSALRAGANELYLGSMQSGTVTGKQRFTLSRRIEGPDGSFGGVVVAGILSEYFASIYREADPGEGTRFALLRADGAPLAIWPPNSTSLGADGLIMASKDITGYPGRVQVSRPLGSVLKDWRERTKLSGLALVFALLAFSGVTFLGLRTARAEQEARKLLRQANEDLEKRVEARTAELSTTQKTLAESLSELQALYDTAPIGLAMISPRGRFLRINHRLAEINGLPVEAHLGRAISEILPALYPSVEPILREVVKSKRPALGIEVKGETPAQPGVLRYWTEHWLPLLDETGNVRAINVVAEEVTEQRRSEAQRVLLTNELNHRLKNTLAIVQAIAYQTFKTSSDREAANVFTERITSLASAHEILLQQQWRSGQLEEVVQVALGPLRFVQQAELKVEGGPSVILSPGETVGMILVLHELGTNALKHGALSVPGGIVTLGWFTSDDGHVNIQWRERNGPCVTDPPGPGFGTRLIRQQLASSGAEVELRFEPEGLTCYISLARRTGAPATQPIGSNRRTSEPRASGSETW
jgi:two-component system CheB/CheR fusion protein